MSLGNWLQGLIGNKTVAVEDIPPSPQVAPPPVTTPAAAVVTKDRFSDCLPWVLAREGGFVNNPADTGGATNKGITLKTAQAALGASFSLADLQKITNDQAGDIYRKNYWATTRCDDLPVGVDLSTFDMSVMSGPSAGAKMLQRAAKVTADGAVGPMTIKACAANPSALIDEIASQRVTFYRSIVAGRAANAEFLSGWLNRVEMTRKQSQDMLRAGSSNASV